jgi:hypothetical protein
VRFLGRKVYLEGVILIACVLVPLLEQSAAAARRVTGIAARTLRRWHAWWQSVFVASALFTELRAHVPDVDVTALPSALIDSFDGATPLTRLEQTMRFLAPLTTRPVLATITELTGRRGSRRRWFDHRFAGRRTRRSESSPRARKRQ